MNILKFLCATFFILSLVTAAIPSYAADEPPLPTPVGRVVWIKGTLKAVMQNMEERTLQKMSVIYEHDTLITDDKSQAQIVFTDDTLMTFRPGTKFNVKEYAFSNRPNKKTHSTGKYVMELIEGGFRTITGLIAKSNPSDYQVNTPVATIGVRGTDYAVYLKNGEIYVGYYEGQPCVTGGLEKSTLCLTSDKPYAYLPKNGAAPVPLIERPEVFQEKLVITPTKISPFTGVGGGGTGTTTSGEVQMQRGGAITSFCITQ